MTRRSSSCGLLAKPAGLLVLVLVVGMVLPQPVRAQGSVLWRTAIPISSGTDIAKGVAVQADGDIVSVGSAFASATPPLGHSLGQDFLAGDGIVLTRNRSNDGSLDTDAPPGNFDGNAGGSSGKIIDEGEGVPKAVAIQPDGKILVAGEALQTSSTSTGRFFLARYLTDGRLDPAFGTGGKVFTSVGSYGPQWVTALAIQPDEKIVVVGYVEGGVPTRKSKFALARYLPNGALDTSFGGDGIVIDAALGEENPQTQWSFPSDGTESSHNYANAVAIQANGRIVIGGAVCQCFRLQLQVRPRAVHAIG